MSTVVENKKIFEYYNLLFSELRMMVIDEMDPADRCRFTRCSKLSNKEARSSKNYIYSLQLNAHNENDIRIYIAHNKFDDNPYYLFSLMFENTWNKKLMTCIGSNKELWSEELSSSTDLVKYAAGQFKNFLKNFQNQIKRLDIVGRLMNTTLKNYDFELGKLKNLENLRIQCSMNVPLYLSKPRKTLKGFSIEENRDYTLLQGEKNSSKLLYNKEIYQVRDSVWMIETKFTNEQFLQLSASHVYINFGDLTELDIFNFIRSWQNGTLGKEMIEYEWYGNPNFELKQLFQRLGKKIHENAMRKKFSLEIKHNKEYGKTARLLYLKSEKRLVFQLEKDTLYSWSTKNIEELDDNYSYFLDTVSNEH